MKASLEHLTHFNCDSCDKWWSIGDFPWGSQTHLWCPWCGYKHELPEEPMSGDDFTSEQSDQDIQQTWEKTMIERTIAEKYPLPGQVYRHRKHNAEAGHWHEYKVVGAVEPLTGEPGQIIKTHFYLPEVYRHTDTEHQVGLIGCGTKIYANVTEPHIAYKSTRPDLCNPEWVHCLRPLEEFMDGRFRLVG